MTGTPGHVNSMARSVAHFIRHFPLETMREGDIYICNDPWMGTGHLHDFTVDLGTFEKLAPKLAGATLVAESGVKTVEDARRLRDAGADAVLVGEAAMRDPALVARMASLP